MANNIRIDVRANFRQIAAQFESQTRKVIESAAVSALNRAATTVRAASSREIRAEYNLKSAAVRDQIVIHRARRGQVTASIVVSGQRIPLIDFGARQTRTGVSVSVKRGSRKLIPHAFLATMRSGHHGVFVRAGSTKPLIFRHGRGSRIQSHGSDLPIVELTSVSLPRAFLKRKIQAALQKLAAERFQIEFTRQLKFRSGN